MNIASIEHRVKPFKKLIIGDPKYLVNMNTKKSTTMYMVNYDKLPNNEAKRICGVYIRETEDDIFPKKRLMIYSVKNNEMGEILINAHKEGKNASSLIDKFKEFKNDTGRIGIVVDDRKIMIPIEKNIQYGCHYEYKKGLAYITDIEFADIEMTLEMCEKIVNSLFELL